MSVSKINPKYLTPNYEAIANTINEIHSSKYNNRQIKYIHKGKHARTEKGIMLEIESIIGPFSKWFDTEGKKRFLGREGD